MDGLFGAAGTVAGASISANATKDAAEIQTQGLKDQRDFVYRELNPTKVGAQAKAADIARAQNRLALQSQIDPNLAAARNLGSAGVANEISKVGNADSDRVAAAAAESGLTTDARINELKDKLLKAALDDVTAGSTLPQDLQAELVKAGLEQGGAAGVGLSPKSMTGANTRKLIGERGLALREERLGRATALTKFASDLENNRTAVLASLFPSLQRQQVGNAGLAASGVQLSESALPDVGLSGSNVANIWMARVGAMNQLSGQIANTQASAAASMGDIYGKLAGGLGTSLGTIGKGVGNYFNSGSGAGVDPSTGEGIAGSRGSMMSAILG